MGGDMRKLGFVCVTVLVIAVFSMPQVIADAGVLTTVGKLSLIEKDDMECVCGTDPDSEPFCAVAVECDALAACESNQDCESGFKCLIENCCEPPLAAGACVPICDSAGCINPGVCEMYDTCEPPLFVSLSSFEAEYRAGAVAISWTTATEIDNTGFRIFRARAIGQRGRWDTAVGQKAVAPVRLELVTPRLMPAQGMGLSGSSYLYIDASPQAGGTLSYYLEDIDTQGKATLHGPVTIVVPAPTRVRVEGTTR
jgi:hypothetical protein